MGKEKANKLPPFLVSWSVLNIGDKNHFLSSKTTTGMANPKSVKPARVRPPPSQIPARNMSTKHTACRVTTS